LCWKSDPARAVTATLAAGSRPPSGRIRPATDIGGVAEKLAADGRFAPPEPTTDLRLGKAVSGELVDPHSFLRAAMDRSRLRTLFSL